VLVTAALIFAVLSPFIAIALFAVALAFTVRWADEREEGLLADPLECEYAAPACERRTHARSTR
jgi:hypothetical protein